MRSVSKIVGVAAIAVLGSNAAQAKYSQAPSLDAKVASGELPPVEQRLPTMPFVATAPAVGTYGGTWRSALKGNNDQGWIRRTVGYVPLVQYPRMEKVMSVAFSA